MDELIPITVKNVGTDTLQTVNLRDLHEALGVGRDFSNWVKGRIRKYGFVEGQDYICIELCSPDLATAKNSTKEEVFAKTGENPSGGRPSIEYHASLDMAKELAMVENNEQGRVVRRYFIAAERKYREEVRRPQIRRKYASAVEEAEDIFRFVGISVRCVEVKAIGR